MVRDDSLVLHGFTTPEALTLFDLLIGVSGIGPRHAHSLLSALTPETLVSAVAAEDTKALSQVPGLGQRTAARIIVELKGKLDMVWVGGSTPSAVSTADDVTEALIALGYTAIEARSAVTAAGADPSLSVEEQIRLALQGLSRQG
jgi:Holliday junction DNA helicase RuvA